MCVIPCTSVCVNAFAVTHSNHGGRSVRVCVWGGGGGDKSFSDLKLSSRHSLFAMHFMPKQSSPTSFAIALTMFNGCE